MRLVLALAFALGLLVSCGGPDDVDLRGPWRLDRMVTPDGETKVGHPNMSEPSFGVGRRGAGLSDGCTWWGFGAKIEGTEVRFTPEREERSYGPCTLFDPTHGAFARWLPEVDHADRDGRHLVLTGRGVRLELSRPRDPGRISPISLDITGGWRLSEGRVDGRTIPVVPWRPATLGMGYGSDTGTLRTGCNSVGVTLGAGWFSLGDTTLMRCRPKLMQAERLLMRGMSDVHHVDFTSRGMILSGSAVQLSFTKIAEPDLSRAIGRWHVVSTRRGGVTTPPVHVRRLNGEMVLRISEDLAFRLATKCTRFHGEWQLLDEGGSVPITRSGASTTCLPAPEEERAQEALSSTTWLRARGDRLALQDDTGPGLLLRRIR